MSSVIVLNTLSPVHIGTGEKYDPLNLHFYEKKGKAYCGVINIEKFIKTFGKKGISEFSRWMDSVADEFRRSSTDNKKMSGVRRDYTIESFMRNGMRMQDTEIKNILSDEKTFLTTIPVKFQLRKNHEVNRQMSIPDGRPYIPGSSLKGALRTAIAVAMLNSMKQDVRDGILNEVRNAALRNIRQAEEILMKRLFDCGPSDKKWQNFDLMRFISISDCSPTTAESVLCQISTVNLKKDRKSNREEMNVVDIDIYEVIPEDCRFVFLLEFRIDQIRAIMKNPKGWNRLDELFRLAFGVNIDRILGMEEKDAQTMLVSRLLEIANQHGTSILGEDVEWAENNFGERSLPAIAYSRISEGGSLFRVGYGSGFLADTIFMAACRSIAGKGLYKEIFKQKLLHIPIGKRKEMKGRIREIPDNVLLDFPSSRRLVTKLPGDAMAPLGWVKLSIRDEQSA